MTSVATRWRVPAGRTGGWARAAALVRLSVHQASYDLRAFWRNGQARFFTLLLPVLFLVIFASVFGGHRSTVAVPGGTLAESVYYVPGIVTLGIIAAALVNLVISVTAQRESGVYKRRRATPVPAGVLIAGRAMTSVAVALVSAAVLIAIGWGAYGAHIPARTAPAFAVTIVIGALAFCCLGFALASVIRDDDAAQPITQAVMLPLYFISGIFVPSSIIPHTLTVIADIFPVRHLGQALLTAYNPHTTGTGFAGGDLAIVVLWGVIGLGVALRRFSWLPRGG